jgi:hypothetical protein
MAQIPINIANPMEDLQQVIAAVNAKLAQEGIDTRFSVQPIPQPGQGCRERFLVQQLCQRRADFQNRGCRDP